MEFLSNKRFLENFEININCAAVIHYDKKPWPHFNYLIFTKSKILEQLPTWLIWMGQTISFCYHVRRQTLSLQDILTLVLYRFCQPDEVLLEPKLTIDNRQ